MDKNKLIIASLVGVAIICSAYLLSYGVRYFSNGDPVVRVTGMAERQITSDLATVSLTMHEHKPTIKEGYESLKETKVKVLALLKAQGFSDIEIKQKGISTTKGDLEKGQAPLKDGYYSYNNFYGYKMTEEIFIESSNVDAVDKLATSLSDLINQDVRVEVGRVSYYYTKLNELKMELLREASADAYNRALIIAEGGKASLGKLKSSSMGVFQIVGRNTNEEYSWGGSFNTSDREKTANITIKANYILE